MKSPLTMRAAKRFFFLFLITLIACNLNIKSSGWHVGVVSSNQTGEEINYPLFLPIIMQSYSTYYVSKAGNNSNGKSWETAWNELNQIDWSVINPGDTIQIDGGLTEMVYLTTLQPEKSGLSALPIKILRSQQSGRNGHIVIFGGRFTALPYCGQKDYFFETQGVRDDGILLDGVSWIVIDGLNWRGITIYGHNRDGIRFLGSPDNIFVRNVEIYDNGWVANDEDKGNELEPDGPGVDLSGANITFERAIIHDNGQDAFQSGGVNNNFILRQSWLYNGRTNSAGNEPFNDCAHSDGVQVYGGGVQSGFLIEESIIGPGFMQGVILGQSQTQDNNWATINDVTLKNDLFIKASGNNIMGYPMTKSQNWVLDHLTIHCPYTSGQCIYLEGAGHQVVDTIIHSGQIYLPDGLDNYNGNCQWNTEGFMLGLMADPLFKNVKNDPFSFDDYTLLPGSPCIGKGSNLTSVEQLLAQ